MLNAPFPFYVLHLGGTELLVGIAAGGFAIASLVMRPVAGWLLDNKSRSRLLILGTLALFLLSLLLLLVPVLGVAIILRIISGAVFAGTTTASTTNACDSIPQSRFGEGIGFLGLGNTLATALGPALGLAIIAAMSFRSLFAASILILILAVLTVPGFSFKKITPAVSSAVRPKNMLASLFNADALPASVVMLFASVPFGGVAIFIALYGEIYHLGSGAIFFLLLAVGTGSTRLFSGRIADKKGEQPMLVAGYGSFLLALALLILEGSTCYYLSGLFFGIGFGASIPALQSMSMRIVPLEKRGSATGTFHCAYDVSNGLGGLIAGFLVTYWGYRPMFAVLSVFIIISILVYVFWAAKSPSAFKVNREKLARQRENNNSPCEN